MTPPTTQAPAEALLGPDPVRGLTVRQPWASAIAHLGKTIENRAKITAYTGWLLIHAGKRPDTAALRDAPGDLPDIAARGVVLAVARLTGCHQPSPAHCDTVCGDWGDPGRVHWRLADVAALTYPVAATGALYLWTPTPQLRHQIAAALPR